MKISNSKKQLAKIIHENGGWRDGAKFAAQGGNHGHVGFASVAPVRKGKVWDMTLGFAGKFLADEVLPNWHQTILSRDEYFHLYPVAETAPEPVAEPQPTIEQLAADYHNRKDYADRKQQEADAAKADAEAKLAALVAAGKALGLVLGVVAPVLRVAPVLSVAPGQKYTGKFYNAEMGEAPAYGKNTRDAVCDGCGKRYGEHYGDRCKSGSEG